jgi:hypothetical protein
MVGRISEKPCHDAGRGWDILIRASQVVGWILVAAAVTLTVGPQWMRPYTGIPHDTEHAVAFLFVGFAFGMGYARCLRFSITAAILLAAALEIGQLMVPGRHRIGTLTP